MVDINTLQKYVKFVVILVVMLSLISSALTNLPITELFLPSAQPNDQYGYSISTSNNLAVIGSAYATRNYLTQCGSGSIWQYNSQSSEWNLLITLEAYDGSSNDRFGSSVSLLSSSSFSSFNRVLIGSPYHGVLFGSGASYLYEQQSATNMSQWTNITQLIPPIPQSYTYFGSSVILSSTYAVISAPYYTDVSVGQGIVFLFSKDQGGINNWGIVKQLNASDPHAFDYFGWSVAMDGNLILVGSLYGDSNVNPSIVDTGTAYMFSKDFGGLDNWGMIHRFESPNLMFHDQFGISVSVSAGGDFILIGASGVQNFTGVSHLFYRNNGGVDQWGLTSNITRDNGQINDYFGFSTDILYPNIAIGAYGVNMLQGIVSIAKFNLNKNIIENLMTIDNPIPAVSNDSFGYSVSIDRSNNGLILLGSPIKSTTGKAYSMIIPNSLSSPLCSLCKILIIVIIVVITTGASIILYRYIKFKRLKSSSRISDDLLEFSPRSDMNFIDIHSPNRQKRRISIESGSSVETTSTQRTNTLPMTSLTRTIELTLDTIGTNTNTRK